jgi:Mrp family chromosome partitioning ATPase
MHTIVLATQKGGSGKSTLAIGIALAAIQGGHNVRLIETDSQARHPPRHPEYRSEATASKDEPQTQNSHPSRLAASAARISG